MKARFFEFSKKANSTKVPDLTQGTELSVVLKSESDLTSPSIELALSAFTPYTYCYLYELEKYFFISDFFKWSLYCSFIRGCACDVPQRDPCGNYICRTKRE